MLKWREGVWEFGSKIIKRLEANLMNKKIRERNLDLNNSTTIHYFIIKIEFNYVDALR